MILFYRIFLVCYRIGIGLAALAGNSKAKQWIRGRRNWQEALSSLPTGEVRAWFHCSSLGEFEQGRPVLEAWRQQHPDTKIVLTFFSPSGYEVRKNNSGADYVLYMPLDGRRTASIFLDAVQPSAAFFVKYDYWHYYLSALKNREVPVYVVSAIFRTQQIFFRSYGGFFRNMLQCVTHFFVQDATSAHLLQSVGFQNATVSGDTRFDRVLQVAAHPRDIPGLQSFTSGAECLVAGSTWPQDEEILSELCKAYPNLRLVIAPHEVNEGRIVELLNRFPSSTRLSGEWTPGSRVLVVDSIGWLSSLYRFGNYAWIGGGFGKGIHNILEAAVYGIPVLFGPRYEKFKEAVDLLERGGAFSLAGAPAAIACLRTLQDKATREKASAACAAYVKEKAGATATIMNALSAGRRT